ncbi:MAG: bifunctional isocitrate dehydrogenase kinase/phosphatase [Chthoniobacterales bacterium]|nr:bifunctional isocitrate dehydrogenase kinase/phosphatase [Chthoniobacterales bacterium]
MNETVSPAAPALTDSRLAALCAEEARNALDDYAARFDEITRRGRDRFLARDWRGSYDDAAERLHLYSRVLDSLTNTIKGLLAARLCDRGIWSAIKAVYSALIGHSSRWEIGESFFNSLTRRIFTTEGVDQAIEFVDTDFDAPPTSVGANVGRIYSGAPLRELLQRVLTDAEAGGFAESCWNDLPGSLAAAAERLTHAIGQSGEAKLELVGATFYRGRGAYLVGRVCPTDDAASVVPVAFCMRHTDQRGIVLDALLVGEADLAILFSYTRAYFRVDAPCPFALVRWLRELMPRKSIADLYNAIGYNRHAKTEFYRDFVRHLQHSSDHFVTAEGTRGMVMLVFTLPSYDAVFKLIRDRFDAPKNSDRREVMSKYKMVFEHDRAGRLVEAHEFEHLRIARDRFDPALLDELLRSTGATVRLDGDDVVIAHAYVERRVRPLNLFFAECDADEASAAACGYAEAIKDLAASNIFAGDLLTKNFGVTRHGRVVFYDYDELCWLTDCNFREMPQSTSYEEEMAAEPWFTVRDNDIFPEEFPNFLAFPERAQQELFRRHGDLFHPDFWRGVQQKLRAGELPELLPYAQERRLGAS